MNSKRQYAVIMVLDGNTVVTEAVDIRGLLNSFEHKNAFEWVNAIEDIFDEVLDLRLGESMYFQPDRDNESSKGIIARTK
jgi:hypothetical protein